MLWVTRSGVSIRLLNPRELKDVPNGTILFDIMGGQVEVGRDPIDLDTRNGYLAYGILVNQLPPPPAQEFLLAKTPEESNVQYRRDIEFILTHHNLWDAKKQYKMPDGRVYYGRRDARSKETSDSST